MDFGPIDTVKTAEACGVAGIRTADPTELAVAVADAVKKKQSLVAGVPIDYADYKRLF
jgi:thiamine pyrophosphate-dependent acetolactate synthase large subunit-like protein